MNDKDRARVERYRATPKGKAMRARQRRSPQRARYMRERRRQLYSAARALLHSIKSVPCMDCGNTFDPVCMDFDHRPGEKKLFPVARGAEKLFRLDPTAPGHQMLLREIAKCDVVCANCHRVRTHRRRDHRAACAAGCTGTRVITPLVDQGEQETSNE